jgi:hypothetical protein
VKEREEIEVKEREEIEVKGGMESKTQSVIRLLIVTSRVAGIIIAVHHVRSDGAKISINTDR